MISIIQNGYLGDEPIVYKGIEINNSFINYCREDKSQYKPITSVGFDDPDNDFLLGNSGGLLMKIDFVFVNTHVYSEVATHFRKHGVYSFTKPGTKEYIKFWKRETRRRKRGMTANCKLYFKDVIEYYDKNTSEARRKELLHPLRITGDHYHFLNYSRIKRSRTTEEKQNCSPFQRNRKIQDFPLFIDGQYWDFKLDEFCVINYINISESKARRKGFTYAKAARSANIANLYKDTIIINVAYDIGFITDEGAINAFVYNNLQWLEENTHWKRGFLKEQYKHIQLGFKRSSHGNRKYGHMSTVLGETTKVNTSAAVGKDAVEINFEESGANPSLDESLGVTLSAIEDGGEKVGIVRVFGTGGTKDSNWIQFSNIFYNPSKYEMVELENVWDIGKRNETCGFFYPQVWGYFPHVTDGNSMLLDAWIHDNTRKLDAKENQTNAEYTTFVGQRANSPEEAFINTLDNIFSSVALTEHLRYIQNNDDLKYYKDGWVDYYDNELKFLDNEELAIRGQRTREYIMDVPFTTKKDITGAVRIYHPPYTAGEKIPPKNSYIVLYDPYGKDKAVKDIIIKNSLASILVIGLRNADFPFHEDKICAAYTGRMNTMEESDLLAIRLADMYGAKIVAEMDRGTMLQTAKKYSRRNVLAKDISSYMNTTDSIKKDNYGTIIGTGDSKLDKLGQMAEWLNQVVSIDEDGKPVYLFQSITDVPFIKEMTMFNGTSNFDRISCYLAGIEHIKYHALRLYKKQQSRANNERGRTRSNRTLSKLLLG